MIDFKLNEKDYKMPTSWEEMTLERYVGVAKLEESKSETILGELYLLKMIEAMCGVEDGELDDLTLDIVGQLGNGLTFLQEDAKWKNVTNLNIDGVDYVFPSDLNKLTMGEYISMKTFQEGSKSQAEAIPYILSIILRPGRKVKDEETGEERWVQDKFTVNNLEFRKELFMKQPVMNLLGPVTFFLNGKQ